MITGRINLSVIISLAGSRFYTRHALFVWTHIMRLLYYSGIKNGRRRIMRPDELLLFEII